MTETAESHRNRGLAFHAQGQLAQAIDSYLAALALRPDYAEAHNNLGNALKDQGKADEAMACYQRALACRPDYAEAHYNLGNSYKQQGRLDEAVACYLVSISFKPQLAQAHCNLGLALQQQGKKDEALARYRQALAIEPQLPEALLNTANVLSEQGEYDEAVATFHQLLALIPRLPEAHNNLGLALMQLGRLDEAVARFRTLLTLRPDDADAHYHLGNALREQGLPDEAIACYQKALSLRPDHAEVRNNLGNACKQQNRFDLAMASYREALASRPDYPEAHSNLLFAMQFVPKLTAAERLEENRRYQARFEAPLLARREPHRNLPDPDRRLKVGYVSADFRRHAVAFFIEPVLARHDRNTVEVHGYFNAKRGDDITARIEPLADHWCVCGNMSDDELADRIRADGIDILVDLAGHTAGNRLLTFARKPAPVQITFLGYPGTSGLAAMDYRITDGCADPPGSEAAYTETLLRLPHSLWCYRPGEGMPGVSPLPALRNGHLTFGSFNSFNKLDEETLLLWAELLCALPQARLRIATVPEGAMRARVLEWFASHGVGAAQVECLGKLPTRAFQQELAACDLALDPLHVNGATTTCEALWLGVPTLSLKGSRFLERAGWSLLCAAGLPELAVDSREDFLALAKRLAADLPALARLRAGLRSRLAASPLMDEAGFTRDLERLYREGWRSWCAAQAARATRS